MFTHPVSHTFIMFSPYLYLYIMSGSNIVSTKPNNFALKYLSIHVSTFIANILMAVLGSNSE
jgi:hypothetical protein